MLEPQRSLMLRHPLLLVRSKALNLRLPPALPTALHGSDRYDGDAGVVICGDEHAAPAIGAELALHLILTSRLAIMVDLQTLFRAVGKLNAL